MDEEWKEAAEILLSEGTVFLMLWRKQNGWTVIQNGCGSLEKDALCEDGAQALIDLVRPQEQELCRRYLACLARRREEAAETEKCPEPERVSLHLRRRDGGWGCYTAEAYFSQTLPEERMVLRLREMDAEEVYRLRLARSITNDKNPGFFMEGAQELLDRFSDREFALIQFDVEKFKVINEQYGSETGDALLEYFIHQLKRICRKDQLYVRLTADVFMILTPYDTQQDILDFIGRLDEELSGYPGIAYRLVYGVCHVREREAGKLRKYGDGAAFARQSVKGNALQHIGFFQRDMKEKANQRKFVEDQMESALREGQFVMYLQPKYSISDQRMVGAEALARWVHPQKGMISPGCFIPVFEENGFVVKLDQYIWEEACRILRTWMDQNQEVIPVSVNVSRRHFYSDAFVEVLDALVEKYRIPKRYLEVEITESVDAAETAHGIERLRQHGYTLLMDDFGSGYSSLNTLKDTPFDVIKMDRAFLQDFIGSSRGKEIVRHTIQMMQAIGLDMVAEGVETREQAEFLLGCGCDIAQGFYYAKPMSLEDFDKIRKSGAK